MEAINFELLIRILVAHLLSDFIFQKKSWADDKDKHGLKSKYLYLHTGLTAATLLVVTWNFSLYPVVLLITGAHFIIDAVKSKLPNSKIWVFLLDQLLHLIAILFVWLYFTNQFHVFYNAVIAITVLPKAWLLLFLYLLLTMPSAVLIGKMTQKWSDEIEKEGKDKKTGLKDAGKWIGIIERVLIFTFVVVNELSVIGFLLAAKSIFRFGDLKESSEHKKTEYIIIGTLLSFALALGVGLLYKLLMK
jgi:hypothetical protein